MTLEKTLLLSQESPNDLSRYEKLWTIKDPTAHSLTDYHESTIPSPKGHQVANLSSTSLANRMLGHVVPPNSMREGIFMSNNELYQ